MSGHIQIVEKPLSLQQMFRLIEIAHETSHHDVRLAAMEVLQRALHPLHFVAPDNMLDLP